MSTKRATVRLSGLGNGEALLSVSPREREPGEDDDSRAMQDCVDIGAHLTRLMEAANGGPVFVAPKPTYDELVALVSRIAEGRNCVECQKGTRTGPHDCVTEAARELLARVKR